MIRRRILASVGCAVAAIAIVATLTIPDRSAPEGEHQETETTDRPAVGEGTESAAVTAALEVAPATQDWLYVTDEEIRADLDRLATVDAAPRLTHAATESATRARESLRGATGPVWWIVRPLAWRVERFSGRQATVTVWQIQILAARDVAAPQSRYRNVTVDLDWVDGQWLLSDLVETDGPAATPAPGDPVWDSHRFDQALEGFTRVGTDR